MLLRLSSQYCIVLAAFSVSALMSALLFRRLDCWIIDHHLWFETWASSEGGQHNLISLFTLCRSLRKARLQYTEYMIATELTSSQFHILDDFQTRKGWVEHYRPPIAYSDSDLKLLLTSLGWITEIFHIFVVTYTLELLLTHFFKCISTHITHSYLLNVSYDKATVSLYWSYMGMSTALFSF